MREGVRKAGMREEEEGEGGGERRRERLFAISL